MSYPDDPVRQVKDVVPPDPKVSEFLSQLKVEAVMHMVTAGERAMSHKWGDAEIHVEIALDRIKMHNEIQAELSCQQ